MIHHDLPPQTGASPEADEVAGAELVVQGLVRALEGSADIIVEKTEAGFELTLPEETGPAAA